IDAGVEQEGSEDLCPILDADAERAGEVADVREAVDVVRAATIAAGRTLTVWKNLAGRHKPQPSVAEERRRGRTYPGLRRRRRRRCLGARLILRRGCP